jgi:DNA-binding NarL/FixJ family response regulator
LALARRTGQGLFAPAFLALQCYVAAQLGELGRADADAHEALESALLSGNVQVAYWASISLARVALARGDVDRALEHAEAARGAKRYSQAPLMIAEARLAAGDADRAVEALETFGWVRPEQWPLNRVMTADCAARVLLAAGRVEEAAAWARAAPAEGGGRRTGLFGAIGAHAEASVLLARGDAPQAAQVALAGAAEAERGHAPLWAGRCRTLAGEALADRAELRRAAAELEQRGATGYRDAALRVLRRLGDRPRPRVAAPAADGPFAALTPREREVAALAADGQTNAQIAARLQLSESTVEKHVSRALGKLGLATRAGLAGLLSSWSPDKRTAGR